MLGGGGFIGRPLVAALAKKGHEVTSFERRHTQMPDGIHTITGDFMNEDDLEQAIAGQEYVFHFISTTNPASSAQNPLLDIESNIRMSVKIMQLCVKHNVKRLIFPSTSTIYGYTLDRPFKEEDATRPISPYAISKLSIERYLDFFEHKHGLGYLSLRITNPYGEGQKPTGSQGVIAIFLKLVLDGSPITVFGDGSMVRDYLYIDDLIDCIVDIFDKKTKHSVYNLGSGTSTSVNDIIDTIKKITEKQIVVDHKPSRVSDVQRVELDSRRLQEEFSFSPSTSLEEGINKAWGYIQKL